jgi:integrase
MELIIDLELCMGMRRGELLGLQWQDVNWEKNQIHIIRSRVAVDGKSVVKQPKTESGTRTLDVPEILMKKLKAYKVKCMEQKIRVGRRLLEEDFIIVHPDGKPIYPEYVSQMFTKLQKKAGLPKCRFHDLRHLCASIMLMQGVNVKVAQEHLGHKDISTTMNIYSHVLPSVAKEAAQKIGALVYDVG